MKTTVRISNALKIVLLGMMLQMFFYGLAMDWNDEIWKQLNIYWIVAPMVVVAFMSILLEDRKDK